MAIRTRDEVLINERLSLQFNDQTGIASFKIDGVTFMTGGNGGRRVAVGDADYTVLAKNSGRPHLVANVSADRTITLPTPEDGLDFEFIAQVAAADGHGWIFTTGSDTNYFLGGVVHLDTDADAAGDEVVVVGPDLNSNSKLQINLPNAGTRIRFVCDGTLWTVSGFAVSTTAPTFADQ